MQFTLEMMPLLGPAKNVCVHEGDCTRVDVGERFVTTADLDHNVADLLKKGVNSLKELRRTKFACIRLAKVRNALGGDIAHSVQLSELFETSTPLAERLLKVFPARQHPGSSSVNKRAHGEEAADQIRASKKTHLQSDDDVLVEDSQRRRFPHCRRFSRVDSPKVLPTPGRSSQPPPPTSAQRPREARPATSSPKQLPSSPPAVGPSQTQTTNDPIDALYVSDDDYGTGFSTIDFEPDVCDGASRNDVLEEDPDDVEHPKSAQRATQTTDAFNVMRSSQQRQSSPVVRLQAAKQVNQASQKAKVIPGKGKPKIGWTPDEDAQLVEGFQKGMKSNEIVKKYNLNRSGEAARGRKKHLMNTKPEIFATPISAKSAAAGVPRNATSKRNATQTTTSAAPGPSRTSTLNDEPVPIDNEPVPIDNEPVPTDNEPVLDKGDQQSSDQGDSEDWGFMGDYDRRGSINADAQAPPMERMDRASPVSDLTGGGAVIVPRQTAVAIGKVMTDEVTDTTIPSDQAQPPRIFIKRFKPDGTPKTPRAVAHACRQARKEMKRKRLEAEAAAKKVKEARAGSSGRARANAKA